MQQSEEYKRFKWSVLKSIKLMKSWLMDDIKALKSCLEEQEEYEERSGFDSQLNMVQKYATMLCSFVNFHSNGI